jgi:uncharacterized protein involved in exopolysaccharide biosynthesis
LAGLFQYKEAELEQKLGPSSRRGLGNRMVTVQKPTHSLGVSQESDEVQQARIKLADVQRRMVVLKSQSVAEVQKAERYWVDLRSQLGAQHPDVEEARRRFEQLKRGEENPEKERMLKQEEKTLALFLKDKGAVVKPLPSQGGSTHIEVSEDLYAQMQSDPEIQSILSELKNKQQAHEELVERLAFAHIELETAQAAFAYRYKITEPPLLPKKPLGLKPWMKGVVVCVASLFMACVWVVWKQYARGTVVQPWQIEKTWPVRVLGNV